MRSALCLSTVRPVQMFDEEVPRLGLAADALNPQGLGLRALSLSPGAHTRAHAQHSNIADGDYFNSVIYAYFLVNLDILVLLAPGPRILLRSDGGLHRG